MEISGVMFRSIPSVSGQSETSVFRPSFLGRSIDAGWKFSGEIRMTGRQDLRWNVKPRKVSGFFDEGHLEYYYSVRCGVKEKEKELESKEKKMKKRLKLLKGLSKDISVFSDMGFGLDPDHGLADQVKGKMISEAADMLLAQLQQLKAEKKEMKRQRKEDKAKLKALRVQNRLECKGDSSSSSESSDNECGEVIDMSRMTAEALSQAMPNEQQPITSLESTMLQNTLDVAGERGSEVCSSQISAHNCTSLGNTGVLPSEGNSLVTGSLTKKIEVCMGGKCKKSGAALLLDEFQRAVGGEGSVVGCKCMGKCRSAPNVKVLNSIDGMQAVVVDDDSVRTLANPLCIGVGLEDVGTIVSNFFGAQQKDLGLAAAS